jgi:DNA polymerase-1
MAKGLRMPRQTAQAFIDKYFQQFPEVRAFIDSSVRTMRDAGHVVTILGRKRRFLDYSDAVDQDEHQAVGHMERQAGNAIIQGSAADIMKAAMISIDKYAKEMGARLLIQVHDEVIVECPEHVADGCAAMMKHVMETVVPLGDVPIITEPKITNRWEK